MGRDTGKCHWFEIRKSYSYPISSSIIITLGDFSWDMLLTKREGFLCGNKHQNETRMVISNLRKIETDYQNILAKISNWRIYNVGSVKRFYVTSSNS